jgi:hypothetical protein
METERKLLVEALAGGFVNGSGSAVAGRDAKRVVDALDSYLATRAKVPPRTPPAEEPKKYKSAFNFGAFPA